MSLCSLSRCQSHIALNITELMCVQLELTSVSKAFQQKPVVFSWIKAWPIIVPYGCVITACTCSAVLSGHLLFHGYSLLTQSPISDSAPFFTGALRLQCDCSRCASTDQSIEINMTNSSNCPKRHEAELQM